MKLYKFEFDEKYQFLTVGNKKEDISFMRRQLSNGQPVVSNMVLELKTSDSHVSENGLSDFIGFYSYGLLMKSHVYKALNEVLKPFGEFLEMTFNSQIYYYFNTTVVQDVVDYSNSEFEEFEGYVTGINRLCFNKVQRNSPCIFKLKGLENQPPVLTEDFVNLVLQNKFTGLNFVHIN
ncbi:hypothetical protein ABMY44_01730 [Pseudoalteromonas sp. Cnat2-41]|uniref:hypothetical protein n=1 Tax=unclassified Pseudoalteromonas TaxID=194690 RepID=UPI001EF83F4C|nr:MULTISPECIES: hypothetical protein [unclassified Pseudoalteromonas]MCF2860883.1 hypothetical protein [Pseudoalteromonas sp. CNAT2-18]MCG7556752.1 hypothetical protein [Pseudoalteromonas sp. CNAT2-18.1]